jgi:cbb3-type cytochrome oxidase maturation protein
MRCGRGAARLRPSPPLDLRRPCKEPDMDVLIYLVPMALMLGLSGLAAFMWSLRNGQYDDVQGAAVRVLSDDDVKR